MRTHVTEVNASDGLSWCVDCLTPARSRIDTNRRIAGTRSVGQAEYHSDQICVRLAAERHFHFTCCMLIPERTFTCQGKVLEVAVTGPSPFLGPKRVGSLIGGVHDANPSNTRECLDKSLRGQGESTCSSTCMKLSQGSSG